MRKECRRECTSTIRHDSCRNSMGCNYFLKECWLPVSKYTVSYRIALAAAAHGHCTVKCDHNPEYQILSLEIKGRHQTVAPLQTYRPLSAVVHSSIHRSVAGSARDLLHVDDDIRRRVCEIPPSANRSWNVFAARRSTQQGMCRRVVSVCLSVRLSCSCLVSKRVNLSSTVFHHHSRFSLPYSIALFQLVPLTGASNAGGV